MGDSGGKSTIVYTTCQVHGKDYMSFELQRGEISAQSWKFSPALS